MNNSITLTAIWEALTNLECEGEKPDLAPIIAGIHDVLHGLDGLSVKGKTNVDTLLGCIMGLEMIVGAETTGEG